MSMSEVINWSMDTYSVATPLQKGTPLSSALLTVCSQQGGASWILPTSMRGPVLCGYLWVTSAAVTSWVSCHPPSHIQKILYCKLWLLTPPTCTFCDILWVLGQGLGCYKCLVWDHALHTPLFSILGTVVNLCVNQVTAKRSYSNVGWEHTNVRLEGERLRRQLGLSHTVAIGCP